MKRQIYFLLFFYSSLFSQPLFIYTDSLSKRNWHTNHSWDVSINLKSSNQKFSGNNSISVKFNRGFAGFVLFLSNMNTSGYDTLIFYVNGGNNSAQSFWIKVSHDGKNFTEGKSSTDYVTIEANKWKEVKVPLNHILDNNHYIVSLLFQENTGNPQNEFFIDEIYLNEIKGSPKIIETSFSSYNFFPGDRISIRSRIFESDGFDDIDTIYIACDEILQGLKFNLFDDGIHNDILPGDGIFGNEILIPSNSEIGEKRVYVVVKDKSGNKTSQEIFVGVMKKDSISIPDGLFNYLAIGTGTTTSNLSWQTNNGNECWDMGYQYITWGWWNWYDGFVKRFCDDAHRRGYIPVIPLYLFQTTPAELGCVGNEYDKILCAINNPNIMNEFWKRFIQMCKEANSSYVQKVIFHIEPDLLGYLQQRCIKENKTPDQISAYVNDSKYPNNLIGMHRKMIDLVREYCPQKGLIAFHASLWGNIISLKENEDKLLDIETLALNTANFLLTLAEDFDLIFMDWSDRDAGYDGIWWDKYNTSLPNFSRVLMFTNYLSTITKKKIVLWQIPVGNEFLPNVTNQYSDNKVEYIFNHTEDIAKSGIIALLFGAGIPGMTTQFTDGGYLKSRALEYCRNGKVNLFHYNQSDSSVTLIESELTIYQNYPNPFSSYTFLKFNLPVIKNGSNNITSARTTLKIYNALGKEVGTLFDEIKTPGVYEIKFNPNTFDLPSGIYFLELKYGELRKIIKITIIK